MTGSALVSQGREKRRQKNGPYHIVLQERIVCILTDLFVENADR